MVKKVLLLGSLLAAGVYAFGKASKLSKFDDNIFVKTGFKNVRVKNLALVVNGTITITNYTGFTVTPKNIFSRLLIKGTNGAWQQVGLSSIIPSVTLVNNQNTAFDVAFEIPFSSALSAIVSGAQAARFRTNFDYAGQPQTIEEDININAFVTAVKQAIGMGMGSTGAIPLTQLSHNTFGINP